MKFLRKMVLQGYHFFLPPCHIPWQSTHEYNKPPVFRKYLWKTRGFSLWLVNVTTLVNGQRIEFGSAEELSQCDAEAVAQSLNSYRTGVLALAEEYALDGGLRYARDFAQFVWRDALFTAKLSYAMGNSLPSFHCLFPPRLCDYTS